MENKKEVNIDASGASSGVAEISGGKISSEQLRSVYPEEDPRKFNTHYSEQEAAEYATRDHTQTISSVASADKEHIHAAREEKPKPPKEYPPVKKVPLAIAIVLTAGAWFFTGKAGLMLSIAVVASVVSSLNYKTFKKEFPRLGFNPMLALFIFDLIEIFIAIIFVGADLIKILLPI